MNQWVGAKQAWINMLFMQACRKRNLDLEQYKARQCFIGVDLASRNDIAAKVLLFPPQNTGEKWSAFGQYYLPESILEEGGNDRYKAYHAEGWLTLTPGNIIDFEYIEDDLKEDRSKYEIKEVCYDPYQATQFSTRMSEEGFPMVEVGATVKNFSEPMKEVEAQILARNFIFQMDPVLTWMFGNVVAKLDKKDNIFPDKERPSQKIDGVVALIMAMNRAMAYKNAVSVYEDRGILQL